MALNPRIGRSYGDALELERRYGSEVNGGALRFLVFKNHARMGGFQQALDDAEGSGNAPDLATGRTQRNKYGAAINWEQRLGPSLGAFARFSWADGKSETFAFTEIDRSITAGLALTGARWGREKDVLGIAFVRNEISRERRAYLAAGGLGFFLGDGALRYAPERIAEIYYSASLAKSMAVSLGYQRIEHPGYNADRGPVDVFGVRVHLAF